MNFAEVMALLKDELRIEVAKIVGFTDIKKRFLPIPWLMDMADYVLSGCLNGEVVVIFDYPNDIAAAWKLARMIEEPYSLKISPGTLVRVMNCNWDDQGDIICCTLASFWGEDDPLSITRAFVFIKTQEENIVSK